MTLLSFFKKNISFLKNPSFLSKIRSMENEKTVLPKDFTDSVKNLLGDEFDDFLKSYTEERYAGLRCNLLKSSPEDLCKKVPFSLSKIDWAYEGFYYDLSERPGKNVLHEAGAYYIQEPSAMSAVSVLDPSPGDVVLDLCAAPGGKSTQIAGRLKGKGLLVSNEIVRERAKILSSNIERMGVRNALVVSEAPDSLSKIFVSFFDKILVDAPCSGEGMFKKEENALLEWSLENVKMCHERQLMILEEAAKMLKAGGVLTYSTCTFNSLENEGTVTEFLKGHPEFSLEKTERFWPHKVKGEGHFVARLKKEGVLIKNSSFALTNEKSKESLHKEIKAFLISELSIKEDVVAELLKDRSLITFGENIYLLPMGITSLKGLKVERAGLQLAESKKNRFEPSHSLALALTPSEVNSSFELSEAEAIRYLAGETISCDPSLKGWILLTCKGFSLAFGKASNGTIKNHYPKGLRKNL